MPTTFPSPVNDRDEPMQTGKFQPTWESLQQYQSPEWFRDAKFGIWAHWGPQCEPEHGDWYARGHVSGKAAHSTSSTSSNYGHPSKFGFKDVIHQWKAENWDPEKLVALYKRAGAQYFFALANHHDNFDLYDSKYQPWNSRQHRAQEGPDRRLGQGGARQRPALRRQRSRGPRVDAGTKRRRAPTRTVHSPACPTTANSPRPTAKGTWWEGFDPQDLYAQNHDRARQPELGRSTRMELAAMARAFPIRPTARSSTTARST